MLRAVVVIGVLGMLLGGCARQRAEHPNIARVQEFRGLVERGDLDRARAMMSEDPRRWFDEIEGQGGAWRLGRAGPWAHWDETMNSRSEPIRWTADDSSATLLFRETNDYFQSLDRGWVTTTITYLFDEDGGIRGQLIAASDEPRPPGRTEEFLAWARAHEGEEIAALMPGGSIDPSGDHPERYRALLLRWREAAGLPPIE